MAWGASKTVVTKAVETFCRPNVPLHTPDWSKLVSLDFETFFDDNYTLKKMSTSEYVRDKRFKAQMVGIKIGRRKTKIVLASKIKTELQAIDWKTHSLLSHNTAFDGLILSHHYGIVPKFYYDTLSMARGLHSNDIGASLDEVAAYYGKGNKIPDVLERTRGVLVWDKQLNEDAGLYCANDVDLMYEIFIEMLKVYPHSEIELIHLIIQMFCDPVLKVDIPRVQAEYDREVERRKSLLLQTIDNIKEVPEGLLKGAEKLLQGEERMMLIAKRIVGSSEKFADLLRAEGVDPPKKISPAWIKTPKEERTDDKKWAYAFAKTDEEFITLPDRFEEWAADLDLNNKRDIPKLAARQERIQNLIDVRLAVKSTTNITRAARFLEAGRDGMSLPAGYAYYRAHTGRLGGNNKMNMQNLTRKGELRLSILAPPGHNLVVGDSGQIECRVNGWLWGQDDLLDAFRAADQGVGRDAYCNFADNVFGRVITKKDEEERFVGKVCVLGLGFMMGGPKLQLTFAKGALGGPRMYFELDRCKDIVGTYRRKNYRIVEGWEICKGIIEDMAAGRTGRWKCISWEKNTIWLPNGMALKYPDLRKSRNEETGWDEWTYQSKTMRKKIYGGLLCENIVQALARIIVMWQMLQINKTYRPVMTTHDEIVVLARTRSAPKADHMLHKIMCTPPEWCPDLPLNSEGGYAVNYSK